MRIAKYRLTIALGLGVLAMALSIYGIGRRASDNSTATRALCALRSNLESRGQQANDFLHDHPKGALGIPSAVIVKSIRDTRQTIHALRGLRC